MAVRLPKDVIDRYVVANWKALQAEKEAYVALKTERKSLLNFINANNARNLADFELDYLFVSIADQYSKFLKKGNQ